MARLMAGLLKVTVKTCFFDALFGLVALVERCARPWRHGGPFGQPSVITFHQIVWCKNCNYTGELSPRRAVTILEPPGWRWGFFIVFYGWSRAWIIQKCWCRGCDWCQGWCQGGCKGRQGWCEGCQGLIMQEGSQEGCKRFATVRGSLLPFGIQTQHTESWQLGLFVVGLVKIVVIIAWNCFQICDAWCAATKSGVLLGTPHLAHTWAMGHGNLWIPTGRHTFLSREGE